MIRMDIPIIDIFQDMHMKLLHLLKTPAQTLNIPNGPIPESAFFLSP
jgi:hypothetical protein